MLIEQNQNRLQFFEWPAHHISIGEKHAPGVGCLAGLVGDHEPDVGERKPPVGNTPVHAAKGAAVVGAPLVNLKDQAVGFRRRTEQRVVLGWFHMRHWKGVISSLRDVVHTPF
jgi:hypothetical protein